MTVSTSYSPLQSANYLTHPKYRPDVDGLRAIAVLAVVGFHAFPAWIRGGFVGVDVFFVISGFLISTIIFTSLDRKTFSFSEFYARRVKRIFPALLLILATSYTFGWFVLLADEYRQLGKHIAAGAGFVSNFVLWNESGYFDNVAETKPLLHLWSLGIEEQFYIIWPLLMWIAWKARINFAIVTVTLITASFVMNIQTLQTDAVAVFYSPLTRFWELLAGSLLAWLSLYGRPALTAALNTPGRDAHIEAAAGNDRTYRNILSTLGVLLVVSGILAATPRTDFPGWWALVPTVGAVLIIAAGTRAWTNRVFLSHPVLVWFGLISYPLYLWHWPMLSFARILEGATPSGSSRAVAVGASVVLAWLTYKFIEKPIRTGKRPRATTAALVVLMAVAGYVGYGTYERDGLAFRMQPLTSAMSQLSYSFPHTRDCKSSRAYAASSCHESPDRFDDTVMLVGDSHMAALTHGFVELSKAGTLGHDLLAIGKGGCNPFINTESITDRHVEHGCSKTIGGALAEAANRGDIKWIILAGRHAARYQAIGFGPSETGSPAWSYRYTSGIASTQDPALVFELGLRETLQLLRENGKKVVFVHQIPELGFDPRTCLQRTRILRSTDCRIDRRTADSRMLPYKESVRRVIAEFDNVVEYDPMDLYCDDKNCNAFSANGRLLYRDDDHMSKAAAEIIARQIVALMK